MIALVTTYFLVFYILIPGALFRFFTSWFVPLKLFERTRTQEATFAVAVALFPFFVALTGVWYLPVLNNYPFPVRGESYAERRQDYHRVASILTASDASKLLTANPVTANTLPGLNAGRGYWKALNRVLRRQSRFLCWYYLFNAIEGLAFGYLAGNYGNWKIIEGSKKSRSSHRAKRIYNWLAPRMILPNISEWYMLLTDFTWPKKEEVFVRVDILQNDGYLYQGRVADYFVDSAGKLTGILLEHVSRFDRPAYLEKRNGPSGEQVSALDFWRNIPSQNFYIGHGSISNLNVRFVSKDQTVISIAEKILDEKNIQDYDITVTAKEYGSHQPDLYS